MLRGIPASALRSALGAQCHPHTLPLSVRIAQKPSIVGSLGPTALKYESSEGKGTSSMGLPPGGYLVLAGSGPRLPNIPTVQYDGVYPWAPK